MWPVGWPNFFIFFLFFLFIFFYKNEKSPVAPFFTHPALQQKQMFLKSGLIYNLLFLSLSNISPSSGIEVGLVAARAVSTQCWYTASRSAWVRSIAARSIVNGLRFLPTRGDNI